MKKSCCSPIESEAETAGEAVVSAGAAAAVDWGKNCWNHFARGQEIVGKSRGLDSDVAECGRYHHHSSNCHRGSLGYYC